MRAIVYKGPNEVSVEMVSDPRIEAATDAIVRITSTGICGSDLHMYEGRTPASGDMRFGHENMGVVEEVGDAVSAIRVGDRVVMPFNIACGTCFNCARGFTNACLVVNPDGVSGGYGYAGMGPYPGGQAEFLRVPFADFNCLKLPGRPGDELEDDFLLLSDVFPTGYHGAELAGVMCGIDAVGYQARRFDDPDRENPVQVLEELVHIVNPTGRIGIVGVYFAEDPGGVDGAAKKGQFKLPLGDIFEKGLSIGMGQTPVKKYNAYLRDLIVAGRAKPSFIVSHRLELDEAPDAYEKFDSRTDGYTKVVLKPEGAVAT
jgi:threonine dehydrogenase-like Zn-dependent dehydrogenase